MELIGQTVIHKIFGAGVVTGCEGHDLTVKFPTDTKKFIFPDAFRQYLKLDDSAGEQEIDALLTDRDEARQKRIEMLCAQQEKSSIPPAAKVRVSPCSQGVFDIRPGEDPFTSWSVSTGVYLSGYLKGSPRVPDRLKANSLCLLTQCPQNCPEGQRQILGAFMVHEDFVGSSCNGGRILAHPQYRIQLKTPLLFWPYLDSNPAKQRWGKTSFKYIKNDAVEPMLFDMWAQTAGTGREELMAEFYRYYCQRNNLPERSLPTAP